MGRELKRVPLDFEWPLNKIWDGFINPHYTAKKCFYCDGTGYGRQAKFISDQWYGYVQFDPSMTGSVPLTPDTDMIRILAERNVERSPEYYGEGEWAIRNEAKRLADMWNNQWCHHLDQEDVNVLWSHGRLSDLNPNWSENHNEGVTPPTASEVNRWSLSGFGHDAINRMYCIEAKCERLNIEKTCRHCNGKGEIWSSPEDEVLYENWKETLPPTGEGYQMWETTSEGSPVSPVFATKDELVNWLIGQGHSEGAAEQFVEVGHAFSFMIGNGKMYKNIEMLNASHEDDDSID